MEEPERIKYVESFGDNREHCLDAKKITLGFISAKKIVAGHTSLPSNYPGIHRIERTRWQKVKDYVSNWWRFITS